MTYSLICSVNKFIMCIALLSTLKELEKHNLIFALKEFSLVENSEHTEVECSVAIRAIDVTR